jgi:hypothetical protein
MQKPIQHRQGDVLLFPIDKLPPGLTRIQPRNGRLVIAEGEVTGHAHVLELDQEQTNAELWLDEKAGVIYARIMAPTPLTHEEHGAQTVQPGIYQSLPDWDYTPQALRRSAD